MVLFANSIFFGEFSYFSYSIFDMVIFGTCILIIIGEHIIFLLLYVVLGFDNGLKTLKNPPTYLSSGIVCLSIPWNLSWTVRIWLRIGA